MKSSSTIAVIKKLFSLLGAEEKAKCAVMVGLAILSSILEVITAAVIVVFAQVLTQPESGRKYLEMLELTEQMSAGKIVFYIALLVGVVYLIKSIVASFEIFYQHFSIQKMSYNFKNKILNCFANADYSFYLTRNSSFGLQVVSGDAEQMFSNGMTSIAGMLSESIVFVFLIGAIVYMNPPLAIMIFAMGAVVSLAVAKFMLPRFYSFGQRLQETAALCGQHLIQFFHAFKEIILLGRKDHFIDSYQKHAKERAKTQAIQTALNAMPRIVIEVLFVGIFVATIAFLCIGHESPAQILGVLGGYLYAGFRLMPGLNRLLNHLNLFKSSSPSIERVHEEMQRFSENVQYVNVPEFKFDSSIQVKDLSFRYLNTKKDSLSNINLEIQKGESIGIVGETGSGKSTLVDVILGLLRPYQGSIMIDGQYPANSHQWHKLVGYVPQSIYLIDDTIAANIIFGDSEVDEERLNKAIDSSQLRKLIDGLPKGVETFVGERGVRLSGGERQRIAIARALYRNPEVLIFDEATSALDNETEAKLMETINAVSKNRTVIMIAHRLSTLKNCDRIVVMNNGNVEKITKFDEMARAS